MEHAAPHGRVKFLDADAACDIYDLIKLDIADRHLVDELLNVFFEVAFLK